MSVLEIIRNRRSVRRYNGDLVPEETLARVLEAARMAPSAKNLQPWKFVVVRDRATKIGLAKAAFDQTFISEADIVIAACGFPERAYPRQGRFMNSWPIDLAIAFEHLILQAAEEGLGTCWIGAFDESEAKAVLDVPPDVRVMAMTPLGWPAESPAARGRKAPRQALPLRVRLLAGRAGAEGAGRDRIVRTVSLGPPPACRSY